MADVLTVKQRSAQMAKVRGTGNESTELALAQLLRQSGISGWRRHIKIRWRLSQLSPTLHASQHSSRFRAFVTPDFVFASQRVVLFIDGCFWHGCPEHGRTPKSHVSYWQPKLLRNRDRDHFVDRVLCHLGWTVLRVWEHELKKPTRLTSWLRKHLVATK